MKRQLEGSPSRRGGEAFFTLSPKCQTHIPATTPFEATEISEVEIHPLERPNQHYRGNAGNYWNAICASEEGLPILANRPILVRCESQFICHKLGTALAPGNPRLQTLDPKPDLIPTRAQNYIRQLCTPLLGGTVQA